MPADGIRGPSGSVPKFEIHERTSPNQGERRDGLVPTLVVLHYTAMESATAACDWLCDESSEVSAHYLISRTGDISRLVPEERRAWHAGAGSWGGKGDVNSRSIGIELDNDGATPFSEPLMSALEALLPEIRQRWAIPAKGVIAHSDIAPGRKIDPGRKFDWARLARQNLAVRAEARQPAPVSVDAFTRALADFGMTQDTDPETRLAAFRSRFRPAARGPLDGWDVALAKDLARRFPVDGPSRSA